MVLGTKRSLRKWGLFLWKDKPPHSSPPPTTQQTPISQPQCQQSRFIPRTGPTLGLAGPSWDHSSSSPGRQSCRPSGSPASQPPPDGQLRPLLPLCTQSSLFRPWWWPSLMVGNDLCSRVPLPPSPRPLALGGRGQGLISSAR